MTTDSNALEVSQPLRGFSWRRFLVVAALVFGGMLIAAAAVAFAYASMNNGRVMPGVSVGGVSVSGLEPAEVEQTLRAELPDVRQGSLRLHIGTIDHEIPYSEIGRDYNMPVMVEQAMSVGRAGSPFEQLFNQLLGTFGSVDVAPIVEWDAETLTSRVAAIAHAAQIAPSNASITFENGEYVVTPGVDGQSLDTDNVIAQALAAVGAATVGDSELSVQPDIIPADISTPAAQAAVDRARLVSVGPLQLTIGTTSQTVTDTTIREWVRLEETSPGVWTLMIDRAPVDQLVAQVKTQTDRPAVDAALTFQGVDPVVAPSQIGAEMDATAAGDLIVAELIARGDGTPPATVTLPVVVTQPEFSTDEAQALVGQVELLGSWTTHYVPSPTNNGGINIRRPADLIDGTIVQPGAVFDFVEVAGPITRANGYGDGAAIIGGTIADNPVLGGGLCSASTTLFNAALRAGFDIGARRNHAFYIDRYPVGLDATIWISGSYVQSTSFTNDTAYPIVVRGINFKRKVTFEIWGVSDGRTVQIDDAVVSNEREAKAYYEFTDSLPPRETERKDYAVDGFNSSVGRTVRDRNGNILHQDTFRSDYRRVDGVVLVGRVAGDPPAGTRIPFSDGLPPAPNPTDDPDPTDGPPSQPSAKFAVTFGNNNRVNFINNSTGSPTDFAWDFGDGGTSNQRNPTHKYTAPGNYTVTLTVSNEFGTSTKTRTIRVEGGSPPTDPPTPTPTDPPTPPPSGDPPPS